MAAPTMKESPAIQGDRRSAQQGHGLNSDLDECVQVHVSEKRAESEDVVRKTP
jgi:hypothetical protein